jgi:hypothetical protein
MFSPDEESMEMRVNIAVHLCVVDAEKVGISRDDSEEDMAR